MKNPCLLESKKMLLAETHVKISFVIEHPMVVPYFLVMNSLISLIVMT